MTDNLSNVKKNFAQFSHDLKNSVMGISINTQMIKKFGGDKHIAEYAAKIEKRLEDILKQLEEFRRSIDS
ncbi:hypothetical protein HY407_04695 [Candidatus Gottesmanbacteria bacterium]|nr:hypothetical protein [Candidatus Gottesmanbacteria bacterium]